MKRASFAALAMLCCASSAFAQQKVAYAHAASATVSIRLFAAVGSIRVTGWDRDSVEITGVTPVGARFAFSEGAPLNKPNGMKGYIELPEGQTGSDGKLTMRVPRGARVWLKAGSSDIDVSGVTGGVDVNIVGGAIAVHGNPKELRAESMDGNVVIDGSPEWMRVKTATGDVTLRGGEDIGVSTISGTIRSSMDPVERAKFETTTGSIVFANPMVRSLSVELETHSGPIDVVLVPKADVEIDAATITGAIDNQWTRTRPVSGRENRGMTLTTASGMGSGKIVVRSFKGTIQLRPRSSK